MAYFLLFYRISEYSQYIYGFMVFLSLFFAFRIATGNSEPDFKVIWVFFLISVPIFSWILYLLIRKRAPSKKHRKLSEEINKNISIQKNVSLITDIDDKDTEKQLKYITSSTKHSIYKNTKTEFFSSGEYFFESLEKTLEKAEKFIFLEYYIIGEGKVWNRISDILKNKAKYGVEENWIIRRKK